MAKIDVSLIPPAEVHNLCHTFLDAIKHYYEDPENLKQFDEWEKEQRKANT